MTRDEIQTLLPFAANESLTGEERAAVEQAVADDAELQTELMTLRAIRTNMKADEEEFSPGEMGLARLMREVELETAVSAKKPAEKVWIWKSAAAVLLAVVIGQAGFQIGKGGGGLNEAGFTLASGDTTVAAADGPHITVGFSPDVTEAELRALLLAAGVEIAAGPSADGMYQVTPTEGTTLENASDALVASDIVEMLELP